MFFDCAAAGFVVEGKCFCGAHGDVVLFIFFNEDFNQIFLRAGNGDVCEVGFLFLHPWKGGKLGRHPGVATEEEDSGPFEAFGFVDGGEGDAGWGIGRES